MLKSIKSIRNVGLTAILTITFILLTSLVALWIYNTPKLTYAFPGAYGYGASTTGGRGGVVYHVKNLTDEDTPGSFRYAVSQPGKRTIVFDVTGNIELSAPLEIKNGNLTIAGQTAPGEGIGIKNFPVIISADNVIVRFVKFRLGDKESGNSLLVKNRRNIMIDHCSLSWAPNENVALFNNQNITMQWCIISESLYNGLETGKGATLGGYSASYHHNLFVSNRTGNPELKKSQYNNNNNLINIDTIDFRNNLLYNWGTSSIEGSTGKYNIVNNYFQFGPATKIPNQTQIIAMESIGKKDLAYVSGNYIVNYPLQTNDNWMSVFPNTEYIKTSDNPVLTRFEFEHAPVLTNPVSVVYKQILEYAGASLNRDYTDKRIIAAVETYVSGDKIGKGIITSTNDVGGYPKYKKAGAKLDSDNDGMADEWEYKHNLNPYDAGDGKLVQSNGYTNLEIYLNAIVNDITDNEYIWYLPNADMLQIYVQKIANKIKK